jgi:23S rRNA (adenine2503-C2)-methyltransferase
MKHVLDMTAQELTEELAARGQPAYRTGQIAAWVWKRDAGSFDEMTDLPAALRRELAAEYAILTARVAARADSTDGSFKLLLELADGKRIETVAIPAKERLTACVSTQVGCAMRCEFCATGLDGFERNLTAGEIVEQVMQIQRAAGSRVTHVVFMGMGEPLANYGATVAAVRAIIDPDRLAISARRVTVSTVGLPQQIKRLAGEGLPITLAISLHAPNDALRRQLVPAAEKHKISEIMEAAEVFFASRHRELTLEYVLIGGVNDTKACAEALAQLAERLRCSVNLIRYNPVGQRSYERPTQTAMQTFLERLQRRGVNGQIRRSRGLDIAAACGQLRRGGEAGPGGTPGDGVQEQ